MNVRERYEYLLDAFMRLQVSEYERLIFLSESVVLQERGKAPEQNVDNRGRKSQATRQQQQQTYSFYNSENETESSDDSEENYEAEGEDEEEQGNADAQEFVADNLICETEAEKRKERRQAKVALEREGDRRRREGLPRNY